MLNRVIYLVFFVFTTTVFAQSFTKHIVAKGETVKQIAQKYNVTPFDIYRENPDAKNGIAQDLVLLIPIATKNEKKSDSRIHEVIQKETVYGIAKHYEIAVGELYKSNPGIETNGIKTGQILVIPKPKINNLGNNNVTTKYHEVLAKETKFSIAKQYGITLEQLNNWNPTIPENLPLGYKLLVSKDSKSATLEVNPARITFVLHEVKAKETVFSVAKSYGVKQDELIALNPEIKEGIQEGQKIKIPSSSVYINDTKAKSDLLQSIKNKEKKKVALLLPFNIAKIEKDSVNTLADRLKKDSFLNMTLDFYAGALQAIDSAKTLGLNLDISILDSEESKSGSNVEVLVKQNNLQNFNAVIGPFYQTQVEKVAALLESSDVPVISPLSKENAKSFANMFVASPSVDALRLGMVRFLKQQKGALIAVVDSKKIATRQFLKTQLEAIQFTEFDDKNNLNTESLKSLLIKDKINYVVLAAEKTGMVLATINTLIASLNDYQIRLVIIEPNPTLDFEEIPLTKLTKLKLTFPSFTKYDNLGQYKKFEIAFKEKNKIAPSQYAIKGFDITFDTLIRVSQEVNFEETIKKSTTEQVENKFEYTKEPNGGYKNMGIFIQQYTNDLTISEPQ